MYELPENIADLDAEGVESAINEALDAFNALNITVESSDDDLDAAEALKAGLDALRGRQGEIAAAADARAERVAALTPEPEPVVEAVEPVVEPEPVAAAATPAAGSPVARAAAAAPEVIVPQAPPTASLIAAADVPGYSNGQELEGMAAVTAAVLARTRGLPTVNLATASGGVRQRYGAALIKKAAIDGLVQNRDGSGDLELVWGATDESRLPGGSLVAAGGWCAPSETLYDLCQYETLEGILSVAEFQVNRGGIRWTQGPAFEDIYNACGFEQTEAEAIAGDCKDCCTVDCPPFDEVRLDAIGLCVKSPLLTEHAYPELVQRFIEGALVAHAHKVNKYVIDSIVLAAGTPSVATDIGSMSKNMEALVIQAIGVRYTYRLSQTAAIEVVAPFWVKELIRIDLAMENNRDSKNVTDEEINSWFSARNLSVQWVYDFQDPTVTGNDVTIPATFNVLMYPAGTWAKGTADVISVDAVYDSPNLEANQYTATFMEEGILAVQKCTHTTSVTIPVCVSGQGVLDDIAVCYAAPAVV